MDYERGTASDQECFAESYLSAPEEVGYEVNRSRRAKICFY